MSQWAEAEGLPRQMTRTWYALPGGEPFAVAGLWRPTTEWRNAYSMIMADGCVHMSDVHDRMPIILSRDDRRTWLEGSPDQAIALCRTWDEGLVVERTRDPWANAKRTSPRIVGLL